jgi:hypothetical protein
MLNDRIFYPVRSVVTFLRWLRRRRAPETVPPAV